MKWLKAFSVILASAMLISLVSCADGKNPNGETEATTEESKPYEEETVNSEEESSNTHTESDEAEDTEGSVTETESETDLHEFSVEEKDGKAEVKYPSGFEYAASGYDAVNCENGSFSFASRLDIKLKEGAFASEFNRLTFNYSSSAPLKVTLTYENNGEKTEQSLFLEEGGKLSFSGLVCDYLTMGKGSKLSALSFEPFEDQAAIFELLGIKTEEIPVYIASNEDKTFYIENEKYRLGVDLSWGGAINYMADLSCPVEGLENMINKHDAGRLVQQSYYGIPDIEGLYDSGVFSDRDWRYNPVQGGDRFANCSVLIDIQVSENSVYIKSQPQDWSLDGAITPSYMENKYTLYSDRIEVYNRFVDFSGYPNPATTQELPALYTVSYFDTLVWYDGAKPWSGDVLSEKVTNGIVYFRESNTETWLAMKGPDGFALGLYVPCADYAQNTWYAPQGSMDPMHNACSYLAPIDVLRIIPYEAIEYSYLLTTGSVEEIREVFTENKDFSENTYLRDNKENRRIPDADFDISNIDFAKPEGFKALKDSSNHIAEYDETEKATRLTVTSKDAGFEINLATSKRSYFAEDYSGIEIEYMIPTSNSSSNYGSQLFVATGDDTGPTENRSKRSALVCDGSYHTVSFDLAGDDMWFGLINVLRFDFFNESSAGDVFYIKSFKLIPNTEDLELDPSHISFRKAESADYFSGARGTELSFDEERGAVKLTVVDKNDPYVYIDYTKFERKISTSEKKILNIMYMITPDGSRTAFTTEVFFCAGEVTAPNAAMAKHGIVNANGILAVFTLDLSDAEYWSGDINRIRLDYFSSCDVGDSIYIYAVWFE